MAVFNVAEVDNAALQCTTLCACGGNCEHYVCLLMIVFIKIGKAK